MLYKLLNNDNDEKVSRAQHLDFKDKVTILIIYQFKVTYLPFLMLVAAQFKYLKWDLAAAMRQSFELRD